MATSALSQIAALPRMSYIQGTLSSAQSTNIGVNDHIMFNTINNMAGSDITLDTSTAYTTTLNANSIGRVTLKAGKTYRITTHIFVVFSGNGSFGCKWVNANTGAIIGNRIYTESYLSGAGLSARSADDFIFTPIIDTRIELRIDSAGSISSLPESSTATNAGNLFLIETLSEHVLSTTYPNIKGYVNFNGTGSIGANQTIRSSNNVSSVFKNGTGDYTINFITPMNSANYVVSGVADRGTGGVSSTTVIGFGNNSSNYATYITPNYCRIVTARTDNFLVLDSYIVMANFIE